MTTVTDNALKELKDLIISQHNKTHKSEVRDLKKDLEILPSQAA